VHADVYANGSTYHDPRLDLLQGIQQGSPVFREQSSESDILSLQFGTRVYGDLQEPYDRPTLADRVPHQIARDQVKLKPSLDLSPSCPILGRANGT